MKNYLKRMFNWKSVESAILTFCFLGIGFSAVGQSMSYQDYINGSLDKYIVQDARVGSLICQDASGNLVLCSGDVEETILGIATNVPYVTLNKPANPNGSKFIFEALVSSSNGALSKGDFLAAGKDGKLVLTKDVSLAYAVLLDDVAIDGKARVKVLKDRSK